MKKKLEEYTDPMFVGVAPRTVQERKMMSKRKLIGAGIGAAIGGGLGFLDQKHHFRNRPNDSKMTPGQTVMATGVTGGMIGGLIGNYAANVGIAKRRRSLGQEVYNKDDIDQAPIFSINGQVVA